MYTKKPSFIYGFHGLDKDIAIKILNKELDFKPSNNAYDWLGNGIYFWENNFSRAKEYAIEDSKRINSNIKKPFVLGTVIDLGNCLDLLEQQNLEFLKWSYSKFEKSLDAKNKKLPKNSSFNHEFDFDFKKRELDCAVIRYAHKLAKEEGMEFDSVRAGFWEGTELYKGAGFKEKNHIQLAILNPNCIKGVFLPRDMQKDNNF
jgi:hypothetical protein